MTRVSPRKPLFERVKQGLEEGIRFLQGKAALRVTVFPDPPPEFRPEDVVQLRKDFKFSQVLFARLLNVSAKTLQSWEQGTRRPSKASLRLLQLLKEKPKVVFEVTGLTAPLIADQRTASDGTQAKNQLVRRAAKSS